MDDQGELRATTRMSTSSISNRKLHCCFLLLITFILVLLSVPLLFIFDENNNLQAFHHRKNPSPKSSLRESSSIQDEEMATVINRTSLDSTNQGTQRGPFQSKNPDTPQEEQSTSGGSLSPSVDQQQQPDTNCDQFAIKNNLTVADEDFQCPASSWPNRCRSCPQLCIEQRWNCDGKSDCPDGSDEGNCHDSIGAADAIYTKIFQKVTSPKANLSLFRPESCTIEHFIDEKCPCIYNDTKVVICEQLGITHLPKTFQPSVFKIKMPNNSISSIDDVQWPKSLSTLVLVNNSITHIGPKAFELAPRLKLLFLSQNQITHLDSEALYNLSQLTWLQMEGNRLETFESSSLIHTPNIAKLYLSENSINLPEETRFDGCCQNLRELLLDHNKITVIRQHWFSNMTSLMWLSLSYNEISYIEVRSFDWNLSLEELNLSNNKITVIDSEIFATNLGIERLHLSSNPFTSLPKDAFKELQRLQSLNLTDVYFDHIEKETFAGLKLAFIYFTHFRYCHYASHARVCLPLTDGLSSTQELLVFPILKTAVRIVALVCFLGNVFVFVWRSVSPYEHYTLSLFVRNLSIADLMMGIYLAAIGYKDWQFQEQGFRPHAIEWMSSGACTTIGFIAILSSELSVFVLTIITIERYRSIISTDIVEEEDQRRKARIYLLVAWILSFLIASYPLLEWTLSNSDFYATNGLCLPLHIDQPFMPGWQYSAIVYLGINFAAVLVIIYCYVRMYIRIMEARQQVNPFGAMKREDAILATRFFFIVITDCVCWIPIVVIKIMALANVSIPASIYGWLVVFIIPINSALNPIVYTLAAPTSMRAAICRWFKKACIQFDQLTMCQGSCSSRSTFSLSSAESNNIASTSKYRRKTTGSTNSTTIEAFESSTITCNSKPSIESAIIMHYDFNGSSIISNKCNVSNCENEGRISTSMLPASDHIRPMNDDRKRTDLIVTMKPEPLPVPSSMYLECGKSPSLPKNNGNKQPADIDLNKLDSLNYRRRQYAGTLVTTTPATSTSCSSNSSSIINGMRGICNENKLGDNQADYLSTYEDNSSSAPLLTDKTTSDVKTNNGISLEYDSPLRWQQQRLINNSAAATCDHQEPKQHQIQEPFRNEPNRNNAGKLIKALDSVQLLRPNMASVGLNEPLQQQATLLAKVRKRRFTEAMELCSKGTVDATELL